MCNLNVLVTRKKINIDNVNQIVGFIQSVTTNSFIANHNGEGFFINGNVIKRKDKINYVEYLDYFLNTQRIITHQRLSTSGFNIKYNHPFESREFVLIHNGIVNDFLGKKGSDTYGFFKQFLKTFKHKRGTRTERIVKTIKKLLDNLDGGMYSIVLLDKETENMFYFKSSTTNIHFWKSPDKLFISTEKDNGEYLKMFKEEFKELEVKDYTIYSINGNLTIKKVGEIKEKKEKISCNWDFINEKEKEKIDLFVSSQIDKCSFCGTETNKRLTDFFEPICEECFKMNKHELKQTLSYPTNSYDMGV